MTPVKTACFSSVIFTSLKKLPKGSFIKVHERRGSRGKAKLKSLPDTAKWLWITSQSGALGSCHSFSNSTWLKGNNFPSNPCQDQLKNIIYACVVTQTSTSSYTSQPLLNINFLYPFLEKGYLSDFPLAINYLGQKGNVGTQLTHGAAKVTVTLYKGPTLKLSTLYIP